VNIDHRINDTDTAAAIEAGRKAADAKARTTWLEHPKDTAIRVPMALGADGDLEVQADALAELDKRFAGRPRAGVTALTEVDSFIAYLQRWGTESTVVYANNASMSFEAVLDDHPPDGSTAAARAHRATYTCPRSNEWNTWAALDGKALTQQQFADFIESRLEDLVGGDGFPAPTSVLQVGRSLNILTKGEFRRDLNPTTGDSILVCKTETDAKSTQIPRAFLIAIPVFEGGERYQVEARVRFALLEARPTFSFTLHRRAEIERDAFGEVRDKVAKQTERLVLAGTP
jgi:uncharacterized protein YfdQ (DUF2303 family)